MLVLRYPAEYLTMTYVEIIYNSTHILPFLFFPLRYVVWSIFRSRHSSKPVPCTYFPYPMYRAECR